MASCSTSCSSGITCSSAGYPPDTMENLKLNTVWDGIFHASTYVFVTLGLAVFWQTAKTVHLWWSGKLLAGTILTGFSIFNLVEGLIDHHLLGIHHERVPQDQWMYWAFLIWDAIMVIAGWALYKSGKRLSSV